MRCVAYLVSDFAAPSHTFVRREVAALRARGLEVSIFSVKRSAAAAGAAECLIGRSPFAYLAAAFSALAVAPIRFLSAWRLALRHRPPGLRALVWAQFHFVEALMLARLLRSVGATHLHVHFANSGATVGLIAAHCSRLPFSLTLHGISETDFPAGLLLREKIERAQFVACASHFMRAQALRQVAVEHWEKCHLVRCGIELRGLPPAPVRKKIEGPVELVCVGRLSPEKGYAGLFRALSQLADEGFDFTLNVVGDGPSAMDLQRSVVALGLSDRVTFVGYLPEAETLDAIAEADALVLASLMEGLPVVLIEALALGKPVVAPRVAGIPELVEDGRTGLLFTPSNWSDLARTLRRLLAERSAWRRWGKEGRRMVESEFSIEVSAARMADLFEGKAPQ